MTGNPDDQPSPIPSVPDATPEKSVEELIQDMRAAEPRYYLSYTEVDSVSLKCTNTKGCNGQITTHLQARIAPRPSPTNFPPEAGGDEGPLHLMEISKRLLMCSQCAYLSLKK